MARVHGPCGCCGISLERGSQLFAIFDIVIGVLAFLGWSYIFVKGEITGVYFHKYVNIPREVAITVMFFGIFNASTGLLLYFVAGYRTRIGCFIWLTIWFPLAMITLNPVKIYESVVVYQLTEEVKKEKKEKGWKAVEDGVA
ncbi:unnamed protein product [Orchesella dallaii]|uniref:Uncharacterized protein n=1 Tax=Orchesella dallaii TaxID=48710 RepID=A0ABP1Q1V6_9HEXA